MITVACVLKGGKRYDATWVNRLRRGVESNLWLEHRFVCLTDTPEGIECETIPLTEGWPGWWSKIELFKPGQFTGRVLYLDLDVMITGSLNMLIGRPHLFSMVPDFHDAAVLNSSVMAFETDASAIFRRMTASLGAVMREYDSRQSLSRGDQGFIAETLYDEGITVRRFRASEIVSYKLHARDRVPDGASVVAFHGEPKMDVAGGWVSLRWA